MFDEGALRTLEGVMVLDLVVSVFPPKDILTLPMSHASRRSMPQRIGDGLPGSLNSTRDALACRRKQMEGLRKAYRYIRANSPDPKTQGSAQKVESRITNMLTALDLEAQTYGTLAEGDQVVFVNRGQKLGFFHES